MTTRIGPTTYVTQERQPDGRVRLTVYSVATGQKLYDLYIRSPEVKA